MDGLTGARDRLFGGLDHDAAEPKPLNADQWVVNSLLQKSIRRGEVEVAQRAALTFLTQKGTRPGRESLAAPRSAGVPLTRSTFDFFPTPNFF